MAAVAPFFSLPTRTSSPPEPLSTGLGALDRSVGGISRGSLTEVCGPPSSGRVSLLQSIVRAAMQAGQYCVWVDTPDAFDPHSAVHAGVNPSQLLWVRCRRQPEQALKASDLLVRAGGFALLILDLSGQPPKVTNRIPVATWFRLRSGAEQSGTALIVTSETSNTGSCARLQLATQASEVQWSRNRLCGTASIVSTPRRRSVETAISYSFAV